MPVANRQPQADGTILTSEMVPSGLNAEEAAKYSVNESQMREALQRHSKGCPEERLERISTTALGMAVDVIRCIDCGQQTVVPKDSPNRV